MSSKQCVEETKKVKKMKKKADNNRIAENITAVARERERERERFSIECRKAKT